MALITLLPRLWREGALALIILVAAWGWIGKAANARAAARLRTQLGAATALIERERAEVRAAAALARATDAARAAQALREQSRITEETRHDYQKEMDDLRARHDAGRLRAALRQAGPAAGGGGGTGMPGLPGAAGGADGTAAPDEADLNAALNAAQLRALQDWVRGQSEASGD